MKILLINCGSSLTYFKEKGLDLDVSYKVSDFVAPLKFLYEGTNEAGGKFKLYTPNITEYLEKNYKTEDYDFIIWGYNPTDYGSELNSTGGYTNFARIKGGAFWASVRMDVNSEKYLVHEMHHLICNYINLVLGDIKPKDFMDQTPVGNPPVWKPYFLNDNPSDPSSNHSQTWNNIIPFLPKLNAVRKAKYKYFTENEVKGLKEEFVRKLDIMREQCGFPFKIESGLRTQAQNDALADSVSDSAHLSGLAVDIRVVDSPKRFKLLQVAFNNGIRRIGIGRNFIHLDMDNSKPQDVAWDYYK